MYTHTQVARVLLLHDKQEGAPVAKGNLDPHKRYTDMVYATSAIIAMDTRAAAWNCIADSPMSCQYACSAVCRTQ
jgi:hypothetical protein